MAQTGVIVSEKQLWVLVSALKEDTKPIDLEMITQSVMELVNEWQSQSGFIWSGSLDDNKTGLAIFEATEHQARAFYDKYDKICSGILEYHLYQWSAMPFLSAL